MLKLKWTECAECWMISVFDYYFGAECAESAECWVFQEKLALLKLKWTECAECLMISAFDYYFGVECADCRVQNVQNVGDFKKNLPC